MKTFAQQVVQDTAVKVDVGIASVAATSSWWMPHFDNVIHVLLGIGAVTLLVSRVAVIWLEYRRNNGKGR